MKREREREKVLRLTVDEEADGLGQRRLSSTRRGFATIQGAVVRVVGHNAAEKIANNTVSALCLARCSMHKIYARYLRKLARNNTPVTQ